MNLLLAAELVEKSLWYPTILGVLVVVCAVGLFCGSVYLLLGTNLGARLGFLVAFTGLMGFLLILSTLWITTASPLNTLKGRIPQWKVQQVVPTSTRRRSKQVRDIAEKQNKVDPTEAANVKAAVDAALVTKVGTPTLDGDTQRQPLRRLRGRHEVHGPRDLRDRREQPAVLEG